ncbi:histidine-type phosphatase [Pseudoclavibacter sp. CFCC 14310]|uniref:histidine-type phosphatase n=1 Tax=Pseudoclavibacter sp. CFCC 14310 TaxID=2615180 RepID=UPI0013012D7D|nr:histidine-type phosphatase [Pseudoclavibacter sp. CFCC 14310]KAB1647602.1 histidine-type phosphatase [Pseudoclavibacter sp. CFCC 14310]
MFIPAPTRDRRRLSIRRSALAVFTVGLLAVGPLFGGVAASANEQGQYYSSKQPYPAPTASDIAAYSAAPAGYAPLYTESVNRHGSRGLSSYKYDALLALMAKTAEAENGFVSETVKQQFFSDLQGMTAANVDNGYGLLTDQGREQLRQIGVRAQERNAALFAQADADGDTIAFETSGEARATESGEKFEQGLTSGAGQELIDNVGAMSVRPDLLYFHKIDNPDGSVKQPGTPEYDTAKAYEDYIAAQTADGGTIAAHLDSIESLPTSGQMADDLLSTVFTREFIDSIGSDGHVWYNTIDGSKKGATNCAPGADPAQDADACGEASKKIKSKVDAAKYLYELYITGADMAAEGESLAFDFTKYFAGHESDAEWFAYLLDAEDFYEKGPSLAGHDDTYKNAQALLDDFFAGIDARAAGGTVAATYRFGHAETVVPFAALLKLPGSTQQAPATADPTSTSDVFSYETNEFRSESVGPMAANVQWDVVSREGVDPATGQQYTPLVRLLYNERETAFNASCTAVSPGSHWYKETELKRCLNGQETSESALIALPDSGSDGQVVTPGSGQTTTSTDANASAQQADTSGADNADAPGALARTGASSTLIVCASAAALLLVVTGVGVVAVARRRHS